jgi:uncharacterized protein DUF732
VKLVLTVQRLVVLIAFGMIPLAGGIGGPQQPVSGPASRDVMLAASSAGTDQEYLDRLTAAGIRIDDRARLIDNGRALCVILDSHSSRGELVIAAMSFKNGFGLNDEQAATVIASAIRVYCPNHEDVIR